VGSRTVNFQKTALREECFRLFGKIWVVPAFCLVLPAALLWSGPAWAGQEPVAVAAPSVVAPAENANAPQGPARISGRIVDPKGMGVAGAAIHLTSLGQPSSQDTTTDGDGYFFFATAAPGAFDLTVSSAGFATQEFSGNAQPAGNVTVPQIVLPVATLTTSVRVTPPTFEIAEAEIKEQEKQKALGFIPNFYVSYLPNAAPLASSQKFELAWKTMVDPVTFGITGAIAGIQQAQNEFSGYGQGADGYAKRYGAAYADTAIGTFIGGAVLPSLLHQDPRYFYKGTGSKKSRLLYAVAMSVVSKGDNGKWQANYSGLIGGLAAGGISNLYYPAKDRDLNVTFENFLIGIGASAAANVLQEFVVKKLTPNLPDHDPASGNAAKSSREYVAAPFKVASLVGKTVGSLFREGD